MGIKSFVPHKLFTASLLQVAASTTRQPQGVSRRYRPGAFASLRGAAVVTAEAMESRLMFIAGPTATLVSAPTITAAAGNTELIVARYVDTTTPVAAASIAVGNIVVTDPNHSGTPLTVSGVTKSSNVDAATLSATYTVSAPGGTNWTLADNGTYNIALTATVTDDAAPTPNPVTANPSFGSFTVGIGNPLAPVPTLVSATPITNSNASSEQIVIRYTDNNTTLNFATFGASNITVMGPANQSLTISGATVNQINSHTAVVIYTANAPTSPGFAVADNGTYTIGLTGNVSDDFGETVPPNPAFGTFTVNIVAGNHPPIATVTPPAAVTVGVVSSVNVVVTYVDNDAAPVRASSITTAGVTVTGPAENLVVTGVTLSSQTNAATIVATYTVAPPSGVFSASDNGVYSINLTATVTDTTPTAMVPVTGASSFTVSFADTDAPTATATGATMVSPGASRQTVVVTYVDNVAIDTTTINRHNITVTAPDGDSLTVVSDSFTPTIGHTQIVTYTVSAPSGTFSAADNGIYTVTLSGDPTVAVEDTSGNIVSAGDIGIFTIDIADNIAPTADITAPGVTSDGVTTEPITVVYADDLAVNVSTIQTSNLAVTDPAGNKLTVASVSITPDANGPLVTATYIVNAPGGLFTHSNNGFYSISVSGVTDTAGHPVAPATTSSTFQVLIPAPVLPPTVLGQFGAVNGKKVKLKFRDTPDGTTGVITMQGGTGTAYLESDGTVDLSIIDTGGGANVKLTTTNGGPVTLNNVSVLGTLTNFQATTANVVGTFYVNGTDVKTTLRHLIGTFAVSGPILNLAITRAATGSLILSGTNLGADGLLNGGDDTFGSGFIGKLNISNGIVDTTIAAGDNPGTDGIFGTSDDTKAGTSVSQIVSVTANKGFDPNSTKFIAGSFGKFKLRGGKPFTPSPALGANYVLLS